MQITHPGFLADVDSRRHARDYRRYTTMMTQDNARLRDSYDAVPYESHPFAQSHPDRLAAVGTVFGMTPSIARARVLEVGCASGGNLLPMAASLPDWEFVGIDISSVQIERGTTDLRALGIANARLFAMDLLDFDHELGTFDYIVAHGVLSWVPRPVQHKLLEVCARHLAPQGIAYISYNTLPGWSSRRTVRDAMRLFTAHVPDPQARVRHARAVLEMFAQFATDPAYAATLRAESEELRGKSDYYVFHEHLEEVNEAFYFRDLVERAGLSGLHYLGEAVLRAMFTHDLAPSAQQALATLAPELIGREQAIDFLRNRTFRQSLFVREGVTLERKLSALRIKGLHAASRAQPLSQNAATADASRFTTSEGTTFAVSGTVPSNAMRRLAGHWPAWLPFAELLERSRADAGAAGVQDEAMLASSLLSAHAAGVVELHALPPPFTLSPGERPCAGIVQRLHASRGREITTLRHEELKVDPITQRLIVLMDGTRTRDAIAQEAWPAIPLPNRSAMLEEALPQLARQALLVA